MEIEHKFLVDPEFLPVKRDGILIRQGYLLVSPAKTIRIRLKGHLAFLTIKGPDTQGSHDEFEYEIPWIDALHLLENYCEERIVSKMRYEIMYHHKIWEVDEFLATNQGLWLAEIELTKPDELFDIPPWAGTEVTGNEKYFNSFLSEFPYSTWGSVNP